MQGGTLYWLPLGSIFLVMCIVVQAPGQSGRAAQGSDDLVREGDRLLRAGHPVLAIRQYQQAIRAGAHSARTQLKIAHARCACGDYEAADRALERVFKSGMRSGEALLLRARIRLWIQDYPSAWPWFREYLKQAPDDASARLDYVLSLAWGRRFDDALIELRKLEQTGRYGFEVKFRRAEILAWKGKYREARGIATRLLAGSKTSGTLKARCHVLIGQTHAWRKRFSDAEREYRKALEFDPRSEQGWLALGQIQEWQEAWREARDSYAKALQVAPKSKRARAALSRLTAK
jgi:tetratricopeptide (TPR) repeat protein